MAELPKEEAFGMPGLLVFIKGDKKQPYCCMIGRAAIPHILHGITRRG